MLWGPNSTWGKSWLRTTSVRPARVYLPGRSAKYGKVCGPSRPVFGACLPGLWVAPSRDESKPKYGPSEKMGSTSYRRRIHPSPPGPWSSSFCTSSHLWRTWLDTEEPRRVSQWPWLKVQNGLLDAHSAWPIRRLVRIPVQALVVFEADLPPASSGSLAQTYPAWLPLQMAGWGFLSSRSQPSPYLLPWQTQLRKPASNFLEGCVLCAHVYTYTISSLTEISNSMDWLLCKPITPTCIFIFEIFLG